MQLNFYVRLDIYRNKKCIQPFQVGVVMHVIGRPTFWQIGTQLHPKNELSCKIIFLI